MKVISFNINSIRARLHQLEAIIQQHQPDVIGLQETKVHDDQFPIGAVEAMGYSAYFHGQKGHYGVATLTKVPAMKIEKGFIGDNETTQRRAISTTHLFDGEEVMVFNGYFPQGESRDHPTKFPYKHWFYRELIALLKERCGKPSIVMGDFNISHQDIDIGIGEQNRKRWLRTGKCSFLPEEREWLNELMNLGYLDTFRQANPDINDRFSWFDYRSKGFEDDPKRGLRIDLILATQELAKKCTDTGIDYQIRGMEKPSDHCPIWATFSETLVV